MIKIFSVVLTVSIMFWINIIQIAAGNTISPSVTAKVVNTAKRTAKTSEQGIILDEKKRQANNAKVEKYANYSRLKSSTKFLVITEIASQMTFVLSKNKGIWKVLDSYLVSTGSKGRDTIVGEFEIIKKIPQWWFKKYYVDYVLVFKGPYAFHSVTYKFNNTIDDGTIGKPVSHGCIRQTLEKSKWLYNNIPIKSKVIVKRSI